MITIYTTGPSCQRCRLTKEVMDQAGLTYLEVDIRENTAARDYVVEELRYTEAPVVVVDDQDHWSGFRPDQIKRLAEQI